MRENPTAKGKVEFYISHGAGGVDGHHDWFIVQPWWDADRQVESLRKAGRNVIKVQARPWSRRQRVRIARREVWFRIDQWRYRRRYDRAQRRAGR